MTVTELAEKLGISRQRCSILAGKGMPTSGVEEANLWRRTRVNSGDKPGNGLKGDPDIRIESVEIEPPTSEKKPKVVRRDPLDALTNLKRTESTLIAMINQAAQSTELRVRDKIPAYIREQRGLATTIIDLEKEYLAWKQIDGTLMSTQAVRDLYNRIMLSLKGSLMDLPERCATMANPSNPTVARAAIKNEVKLVIETLNKELAK